jgi:hypothetical protein
MSECIVECVDLALKCYEAEVVKTYADVFEVINMYWNDVLELASEVLGGGWIDLGIANIVWDVVNRLREKVDEEGIGFWKVKGMYSVVGWVEEGGVIAKVLVNKVSKKMLVTVEGKQGKLSWTVGFVAGENLSPEFSFSVAVRCY